MEHNINYCLYTNLEYETEALELRANVIARYYIVAHITSEPIVARTSYRPKSIFIILNLNYNYIIIIIKLLVGLKMCFFFFGKIVFQCS